MAVTIKCTHCGATIKSAKPVPAGKKVKCPKCAKPFVVSGDAAGKKDKAKPATPAAAEDDNPFASMGPGDPSTLARAKAKKSPLKMILLGCGTVVLLSCCCGTGVSGWFFQDNIKGWFGVKKDDEKKAKGKGQPDFSPNPRTFAEEVTKDVDEANKKYLGKIIEIAGEVDTVERLGKDGKLGVVTGIDGLWVCEFSLKPADEAKAARLSRGQKVKIAAAFKGVRDRTFLTFDSGALTELEPGKFQEIGSEKLVEEFLKDARAAGDKYKGVLLISGQIVEFDQSIPQVRTVKMKGAGKALLWLDFNNDNIKEADRLAKAKTVTIRTSDVLEYNPIEKRLVVNQPLVVESK